MNDVVVTLRLKADGGGKTAAEVVRVGNAVDNAGEKSDRASKKFNRASKSLDTFRKRAKSLNGALGVVGLSIAGFSAQRYVREISSISDEYTNIHSRLKLVADGTQNVSRLQDELFQSAQRTSAEFGAIADLYTKTATATRELGLAQQQQIQFTELVAQSFQISGAGAAEQAGAIRQLSQALQSGVLRGDEFNSINEQGGRLMQALADGLGVARGELRGMAEDGQLTADVVLPALLSQAGKINDEFSGLSRTVGKASTELSNSFQQALASADSQPLIDAIDDLKRTVSDPETQQGLADLATGLVSLAARVAEAAGKFGSLTVQVGNFIGESLARLQVGNSGIADELERVQADIRSVEALLGQPGISASTQAYAKFTAQLRELRQRELELLAPALAEVEGEFSEFLTEVVTGTGTVERYGAGTAELLPPLIAVAAETSRVTQQTRIKTAAEIAAEKATAAAKATYEQQATVLRTQIQLIREGTAASEAALRVNLLNQGLNQSQIDSLIDLQHELAALTDLQESVAEAQDEWNQLLADGARQAGQVAGRSATEQLELHRRSADRIEQIYFDLGRTIISDFDNAGDAILDTFKQLLLNMALEAGRRQILIPLVQGGGEFFGVDQATIDGIVKEMGGGIADEMGAAADGIGAKIGGAFAAYSIGSGVGGQLAGHGPFNERTGELTGIGSSIGYLAGGPLGAAIGAGVGALAGAIMGNVKLVGRELTVKIGDVLDATIKDTLKKTSLFGSSRRTAIDYATGLDRELNQAFKQGIDAVRSQTQAFGAEFEALEFTVSEDFKDKSEDQIQSILEGIIGRAVASATVPDLLARNDNFAIDFGGFARSRTAEWAANFGTGAFTQAEIDATWDQVSEIVAGIVQTAMVQGVSLAEARTLHVSEIQRFFQNQSVFTVYTGLEWVFDYLAERVNEDVVNLIDGLTAAYGGLDQFIAATNFFEQNFIPEAERMQRLASELETGFMGLGLAMPETLEQARALRDGLNALADPDAIRQLDLLLPGVLDLIRFREEEAEATARTSQELSRYIDGLTGSSNALRRAQTGLQGGSVAAFDLASLRRQILGADSVEAVAGLLPALQSALDARYQEGVAGLRDGADEAIAAATRLNELQLDGIDTQIEGLQEQIQLGESMRDAAKGLRDYVADIALGGSRTQAERGLADLLAAARGGNLDAAGKVQSAASAAIGFAQAGAASRIDFLREQNRILNSVTAVADVLGAADVPQQQLEALQGLRQATENAREAQIQALQDGLKLQTEQLASVLNGSFNELLDAFDQAALGKDADLAAMQDAVVRAINGTTASVAAISGDLQTYASTMASAVLSADQISNIAVTTVDALAPDVVRGLLSDIVARVPADFTDDLLQAMVSTVQPSFADDILRAIVSTVPLDGVDEVIQAIVATVPDGGTRKIIEALVNDVPDGMLSGALNTVIGLLPQQSLGDALRAAVGALPPESMALSLQAAIGQLPDASLASALADAIGTAPAQDLGSVFAALIGNADQARPATDLIADIVGTAPDLGIGLIRQLFGHSPDLGLALVRNLVGDSNAPAAELIAQMVGSAPSSAATMILSLVGSSNQTAAQMLTSLVGQNGTTAAAAISALVGSAPQSAAILIQQLVGSSSSTAATLVRNLVGSAPDTAAQLVAGLVGSAPQSAAALIQSLVGSSSQTAAQLVTALVGQNGTTAAAAIGALVGSAPQSAAILIQQLVGSSSSTAATLVRNLVGSAPDTAAQLVAGLVGSAPQSAATLIQSLVGSSSQTAAQLVTALVGQNGTTAAAAISALVGSAPRSAAILIQQLVGSSSSTAATLVRNLVGTAPDTAAQLVAGLVGSAPQSAAALIQSLVGSSSQTAAQLVTALVGQNGTTAAAAISALVGSAPRSAAILIQQLVGSSSSTAATLVRNLVGTAPDTAAQLVAGLVGSAPQSAAALIQSLVGSSPVTAVELITDIVGDSPALGVSLIEELIGGNALSSGLTAQEVIEGLLGVARGSTVSDELADATNNLITALETQGQDYVARLKPAVDNVVYEVSNVTERSGGTANNIASLANVIANYVGWNTSMVNSVADTIASSDQFGRSYPAKSGTSSSHEMQRYATGGIATGPRSGYQVELHGREAVLPLGESGESVPVKILEPPPVGFDTARLERRLIALQEEVARLNRDNRNGQVAMISPLQNLDKRDRQRHDGDAIRVVSAEDRPMQVEVVEALE